MNLMQLAEEQTKLAKLKTEIDEKRADYDKRLMQWQEAGAKLFTLKQAHSEPKVLSPREKTPYLYWNPRNHKQGWTGRGQAPEWAVREMDSKPNYIHKKNPLYVDMVSDGKHRSLADK